VRELDDTVQIQNDRSGTFSCDNISMENVALMFGSDTTIETQSAVTGWAELLTVNKGLYFQLGADDEVPDGVGEVANVVVTNNAGTYATGTITVGAQPANNETVSINGQAITFVTGTPTGQQVQIGATTTVTAQALITLINENKQLYKVSASGATNAVTLTAVASGTGGNSITLAETVTAVGFTVSGATLSGGTASGIINMSGNYEVDLSRGRIHILDNATSIIDDEIIEVQYDIVSGTRSLVVDESNQVEGALRFIADNPKGLDKDFYWPRVRLTPQGEYQLKGDTWQTMNFAFTVIKDGNKKRVYVREI
jgi:hypothetical protein